MAAAEGSDVDLEECWFVADVLRASEDDVPCIFIKVCLQCGQHSEDTLARCSSCQLCFCAGPGTSCLKDSMGKRLCCRCDSVPLDCSEAKASELSRLGLVRLESSSDPLQQAEAATLRRLQQMNRPWSQSEEAAVRPRALQLLAEEPSWLPRLVSHALHGAQRAHAEGLPAHGASSEHNVRIHEFLDVATTTAYSQGQLGSLRRCGASVVLEMLRFEMEGVACDTKALEKALQLLDALSEDELEPIYQQLLGACFHDDATSTSVRIVQDWVFSRCRREVFAASTAYLTILAYGHNEQDLFQGMVVSAEQERVELEVRRLGEFVQRLLRADPKATLTSQWLQETPLPTHRIRIRGTATAEQEKTSGATGSKIVRFEEGVSVLLKQDASVAVEHAVASAMRLMEDIVLSAPQIQHLLHTEGLRPERVRTTYRVLRVSPDTALIEMLPKAPTLREVTCRAPSADSRRQPTGVRGLEEYFVDVAKAPEDWPKVLAFSAALTSLCSLVVHLGDRHEDNVVLTNDGRYAQIDFGWVLGQGPTVTLHNNPPVRLDYNAIWGAAKKENMERIFWPVAHAAFAALREHAHVLAHAAAWIRRLQFPEETFTESFRYAQNHIGQRLLPGLLTDMQARWFLEGIIFHYGDDSGLQMQDAVRRRLHSRDYEDLVPTSQAVGRWWGSFSNSLPNIDNLRPTCVLCEEPAVNVFFYGGQCPHCKRSFCKAHQSEHHCEKQR